MNWQDYFEYNNGQLYWKIKPSKRVNIGEKAGSVNRQTGYVTIQFQGRIYLAHRIIWEMHYGPIPEGMEVDHIWHDRKDNRIENLRLVTRTGNQQNRSKGKNNKSGVNGVNWNSIENRWEVFIGINGTQKYIGRFIDFNEAVKARKEAEKQCGYHENHGK